MPRVVGNLDDRRGEMVISNISKSVGGMGWSNCRHKPSLFHVVICVVRMVGSHEWQARQGMGKDRHLKAQTTDMSHHQASTPLSGLKSSPMLTVALFKTLAKENLQMPTRRFSTRHSTIHSGLDVGHLDEPQANVHATRTATILKPTSTESGRRRTNACDVDCPGFDNLQVSDRLASEVSTMQSWSGLCTPSLLPQSNPMTPWGENLGPDVSRSLFVETNRRLLESWVADINQPCHRRDAEEPALTSQVATLSRRSKAILWAT